MWQQNVQRITFCVKVELLTSVVESFGSTPSAAVDAAALKASRARIQVVNLMSQFTNGQVFIVTPEAAQGQHERAWFSMAARGTRMNASAIPNAETNGQHADDSAVKHSINQCNQH
jgi:hypothetical protein